MQTAKGFIVTAPTRYRSLFPWAAPVLAACCVLATPRAAIGQDPAVTEHNSAKSIDEKSPEAERPTSVGAEVSFRSGHADRGFVINDRAVFQPVAWVSARGAEFSLWGSLPLAETTDSERPRILEMELTKAFEWRNLSIAPAARMYFYHDPVSPYSTRSIESWLYVSLDAGPIRLFTNHSLDVMTYRGAYFGEAGIESEGSVSRRLEVGGSSSVGWASATFNDAWAEVTTSGVNRVSVEGWLTAHVNPRCYISPHVEFSTTVNRGVRAELSHPTFLLFRLTTGVEF